MSRVVTIPSNMSPLWECEINGVKYAYQSGAEVEVPDEVADLIGNMNADAPKEAKRGFRLLNRIQLAENVAVVSISEDSDGRPLKLKKAWMRIFSVSSDTGIMKEKASGTAYFSINNETNGSVALGAASSAYYYVDATFELKGDILYNETGYKSTSGSVPADVKYMYLYSITRGNAGRVSTNNMKEINSVEFRLNISDLKAGTIVELWGEE